MPKPGKKGFARICDALGYSRQGLLAIWRNEAAFRQEVVFSVALLPAALWLGENAVQRGVLIGSLLLVLIVELLNSAIEALADRFGAEIHPLLGNAKDMGSAAVLLSLLLVAVIWLLIAWERFV